MKNYPVFGELFAHVGVNVLNIECLVCFRGSKTTRLSRDYSIRHCKDRVMHKTQYDGMSAKGFERCSSCFHVVKVFFFHVFSTLSSKLPGFC